MATREERSRTRGRFFSSVNFLNWFPGSYDTREYQYHSMWNYMSSPMAVASIALILCVIGLCGYHSVKWIARHDIEINQYDFETKGTYPEFPTFAVSIENDLVPEYLIVRFSLVTIFNQNRSDRNVTPCGLGHPCYPLENLNATAFICPPEDCYHVEGSLASSVFSFTRIEISKNPDVDTTNLSKAIMGIRAQLYVGTSFCDYPNRVKRNCVKVVNGDIRWTGFFDPDVVLINDYNLRYINVIDTRRIALRGQHVKSIWVIQCTEEHIEVAAESPAHNNSVASLNLLLDTTTTEVYRNHENGLDFLEEIGSVFGLAGFVGCLQFTMISSSDAQTALVITMVNKVAWCFCHGKMVQKVCPCTKKATEENKRLLEYENLFSDPKGKRFCCTGSISLRTMNK
ncbi:hypothetical protein Pelo_6592 [Pelomyxa schiedti]|nr:hypothetical protein Pelo_6592 [Pelomyxa schiedti]